MFVRRYECAFAEAEGVAGGAAWCAAAAAWCAGGGG